MSQRTLSNGAGGTSGGGEGGSPDETTSNDEQASDERPGEEAGKGAGSKAVPAGRGRGAFSQFLRMHEVRMLQYTGRLHVDSGSAVLVLVSYSTFSNTKLI